MTKIKEIISNINNTYTIKMNDGWSVTANMSQLEKSFKECYTMTLLPIFKQLNDEQTKRDFIRLV
jgi:hypothetical protein